MLRAILWLYAIISIVNISSNLIPSESLNVFTKPLLMPLLLFYVYKRSIGNTTLKVLLLSGAILFSWFGDISMMYQKEEIYFMLGIGLFLVAHLLYIAAFRKAIFQKPAWRLVDLYPLLAILYGGIFFYLLLPAGAFTVPIIIYGIVIIWMTISAYLRKEVTSIESYRLTFIGSVLFVLSDSILAVNVFKYPIEYSGILVMTTYCAAQYFLAVGLLKHPD